jgi:hypothetical protein
VTSLSRSLGQLVAEHPQQVTLAVNRGQVLQLLQLLVISGKPQRN